MEKKMEILYKVHNNLYINLTNRCPYSCTFCLRQKMDKVGESDTLWLIREPTAEEVIEMMMAGASAVEIGAANLINPFAAKEIIGELPEVMDKYNIKKLSDIIGGAH